jgi:hypothetical protein
MKIELELTPELEEFWTKRRGECLVPWQQQVYDAIRRSKQLGDILDDKKPKLPEKFYEPKELNQWKTGEIVIIFRKINQIIEYLEEK